MFELKTTEYLGNMESGVAIDIFHCPIIDKYKIQMWFQFENGAWGPMDHGYFDNQVFSSMDSARDTGLDEASRWCIDNQINFDPKVLVITGLYLPSWSK